MEKLTLKMEVAELKRPIQTMSEADFCGDATFIRESETSVFMAIFDGAGHGYSAHKNADIAMQLIKKNTEQELCPLLLDLHQALKGTGGGVAGLCRVNKNTGQLSCAGIGNISVRLFKPESLRIVMRGGVLGYEMVQPKLYQHQLKSGDVLMLYSDGVSNSFKTDDFPQFFTLRADEIARITIDYFSKILDDAAVIVLKVNND